MNAHIGPANDSQYDMPADVLVAAIQLHYPQQDQLPVVTIDTSDESFTGYSWVDAGHLDPAYVHKARIELESTAGPKEPIYYVSRIDLDNTIEVFSLIPHKFGCHEGIVYRFLDTVEAIQSRALRTFLSDAFTLRTVYRNYWTCPASQRHHHSYRGGLALHSIEMAESVVKIPHLSATERDFGVVFSLLHDIGKIWCYGSDRPYTDWPDHETAAVECLAEPLGRLQHAWPDAAYAIGSLLGGQWKSAGTRPIMAVGRLIQGLDQVSVEQDLGRGCDPQYSPWIPAPEPSAPLRGQQLRP